MIFIWYVLKLRVLKFRSSNIISLAPTYTAYDNVLACEQVYECVNYVVLVVVLESGQYRGFESSEFVKIVITISGGLSALPISLVVTTTGQTATGEGYINN